MNDGGDGGHGGYTRIGLQCIAQPVDAGWTKGVSGGNGQVKITW